MAIINGNAGNNVLDGKAEADTISGFAGNDTITGGLGNDLARMGAGNDTFIWHADDGDDVLRGQDGFDTLVFEGFGTSELIGIGRNASRVSVAEFFGNGGEKRKVAAQPRNGTPSLAQTNPKYCANSAPPMRLR